MIVCRHVRTELYIIDFLDVEKGQQIPFPAMLDTFSHNILLVQAAKLQRLRNVSINLRFSLRKVINGIWSQGCGPRLPRSRESV